MQFTLTAPASARHRRAIAFVADGAYARYALHAAAQIDALSPDRDFDILLIGLTEVPEVPDSLRHLGIRACRIDPGTAFDGLRLDTGRSQIVYLRLALPQAFAAEYDRILYLDADIFVERGDFAALLTVPLGDRALAAVRDNSQWRTPRRRPRQFVRLGLPTAPYFNAGVMLIDTAAWIRQEITERAVALGRANSDKMIRHDQNLLNAVLRGDWAEMHPAWNWQYTRAANLFAGMMDPNVLHFIGPEKPWTHDAGRLPLRFSGSFARFLARHVPAEAPPPATRQPHANRAWLKKSLVRHWMAADRFCDYLDRFDSDLTVLT